MSFQERKKNKTSLGFTLVELMISVFILTILLTFTFVKLNPDDSKQKARDSKRLSDLATLQRAISEYAQDTGSLPDSLNTLRTSNVVPVSSADLYTATGGWIAQDLGSYLITYPTDPLNNDEHYYSYIHDATSFELNVKLETLVEYAQNDGGNDSTTYEVGTNLLLIEP